MKYLSSLVVIAGLACAVLAKPECEVPCTRELMPVCGSDGEHFKVFANKCILRNEHCRDGHNWFQTRMEECAAHSEDEQEEECETPCTREYMPVCGSDGVQHKIFPNKCVLRNEHCKHGHSWFQTRMDECGDQSELEEEEGCEVPCTREYLPVCGTDGVQHQVFPNKCVLRNEHCKSGHSWFQTRMDECADNSEFEEKKDCEVPCSREYMPVCGTDGVQQKIFPNKCVLTNEHCKNGRIWFQTRMDDCGKPSELEQEEGCEVACTREYFPVCGTDGVQKKKFGNKCMLGNEHCKDGHEWFQTRMSECSELKNTH